eukprot:scaffold13533_cov90-Skeletonema_dohrnii-CCMP3373.AAC.11
MGCFLWGVMMSCVSFQQTASSSLLTSKYNIHTYSCCRLGQSKQEQTADIKTAPLVLFDTYIPSTDQS